MSAGDDDVDLARALADRVADLLEPQRVLLMPEGDLDYWSDDLLDLVALS